MKFLSLRPLIPSVFSNSFVDVESRLSVARYTFHDLASPELGRQGGSGNKHLATNYFHPNVATLSVRAESALANCRHDCIGYLDLVNVSMRVCKLDSVNRPSLISRRRGVVSRLKVESGRPLFQRHPVQLPFHLSISIGIVGPAPTSIVQLAALEHNR
jgi:hypothetical protein